MLPLARSNWVVITGFAVTAAGIVVYTQLDRVVDLRVSWTVLNGTALASMAATAGGLLTAIVGSVIWARRASISHLVWVVVSIGAAVFLLLQFVNINIHRPSGVPLFFVVVFAAVDAALLFLILVIRWREYLS